MALSAAAARCRLHRAGYALKHGSIALVTALVAPRAWAHSPATLSGADALQLVMGVLLAVAALLYVAGCYRLSASKAAPAAVKRGAALFFAGWVTLVVALVSPLAAATEGLFSAHMIQHELMMVIGAPLLVLGRPLAIWTWALPARWRSTSARAFQRRTLIRVWMRLTSPVGATVVHAAAIWVWHVPRVFELSETSVGAHALQHVAFLFSGVLFWWALLKPARGGRIGAALACLFITMLHTGVLGVLLTFSSDVWYPAATAHASRWGLTPLEDQQLGGLVMWVVGGLPYVAAALALAARWLTLAESRDVPRRTAVC